MRADEPAATPEFERIEWEALDGGGGLERRDVAFLVSLVGLVATALYHRYEVPPDRPLPLVGFWEPLLVDWVFFVSLLIVAFYVVVPLVQHREVVRSHWPELRRDPVALGSLVWLTLFFALGTLEPVVVGTIPFGPLNQPPVGFSIYEGFVGRCAGGVTDGMCHGTLAHPLGTTGGGKDLLLLTVAGMRTALQVVLATATIIVPLGIGVGTVAGYLGGRVDELLMRYVDVQQTIPALFIYMAAAVIYGPSLMLMIVVFGFLNWGNVARMVRSEVLRIRELEFVTAARNAGVGRWGIVRRHVVPNVSATVLTATAVKLPMLVVIEATLSYLKLGDPRVVSWGNVVSVGVLSGSDPTVYWWVGVVPIGALVLTALAISLLGSTLQDVVDPRSAGGPSR